MLRAVWVGGSSSGAALQSRSSGILALALSPAGERGSRVADERQRGRAVPRFPAANINACADGHDGRASL